MKFEGFGKATREMVEKFEQHIGFSLPEEYKYFLREYNGGITSKRYSTFYVKILNEEITLGVLYGLEVKKEAADLYYCNDEYMTDLLPNSIIIGHDPGSAMIVLINDPEARGIYYWAFCVVPTFNCPTTIY